MDHSYYSSSPDNVPMAPLSNLSHMQHVVRSQHHSTSISTGKYITICYFSIYRSLGKIRREKIFVGRHVRRKLNT